MSNSPIFVKYQSGGEYNVIDQSLTTGNVFFVDSGSAQAVDAAGAGRNPDYPFATWDYAVGNCVAANGDVIYLMPGHAENIATAGAITCDVQGIKVIGLGEGADRPTITSTNALGSVVLTCTTWLENIIFSSGIDATVNMINVADPDCVIKDCLFVDTVDQATDMIVTVADSDRLLIEGCVFRQAVVAGPNSAIALVASDDVVIRNCVFTGDYAVGAIDFRGTASAGANIHDCKIWTYNAADIAIIDTITGSTGTIGPNLQIMLNDNAANITTAITGATFYVFDPVYVCNLAGEKAMLIDWTASTD